MLKQFVLLYIKAAFNTYTQVEQNYCLTVWKVYVMNEFLAV